MEVIDTVIIGGGQAGLATSYYLTRAGHEHIVLEQAAQAASAWRNGRWDSFTLVTPNWTLMLPGAPYAGADRDGFMPRAELVTYFEQYIDRFQLPIQCNTPVLRVEPLDHDGYQVQTPERPIAAKHVVIATGFEQHPSLPPFAGELAPDVTHIHTSAYRNPEALTPGAVLVVGSGQSGCQIAEELHQHGREVFLCTGRTGRVPRRYRGKDVFEWLLVSGFLEVTPDRLPYPKTQFTPPHVSGTGGGHTLNLHQFARDGITLLGRLLGVAGERVRLAPDLHANLAIADQFEREVQTMIDGYIQTAGIDAPAEELPELRDGYALPQGEELDLRAAGITTVIWATGYRYDYSLVHFPVLDDDGFPIQQGGISSYPGLYFVGMPWMPSLKTGTLPGVGPAAAHIAAHIAGAHSA